MCTHCAFCRLPSTIFEPLHCSLRWLWQNSVRLLSVARKLQTNQCPLYSQPSTWRVHHVFDKFLTWRETFSDKQLITPSAAFSSACLPSFQTHNEHCVILLSTSAVILSSSMHYNYKRNSSLHTWIDQWIRLAHRSLSVSRSATAAHWD